MATIFSRIISGELPSHKVYEDNRTFAFMDIHPIQTGHVLVVPKKEVANFEDLENDDLHAVMNTTRLIAKKIKKVFNCKKVGIIVEGLELPEHVHVKVFPINNPEDLRHLPDDSQEPDHTALEEIAEKLRIE